MKVRITKKPGSTGDQRNYGLVRGSAFDPYENKGNTPISDTMGAVPRSEANIEAEGGETIVGDLNNDGFLEHFKITGKRHSKGGVPLNVPGGSFIFSDTRKLAIKDEEVLARFGKSFKKGGYTPAEIAKQYDINKYMQLMKSDDADAITKRTAGDMVKKNSQKLAELALVQESMKGFPNGVPSIAAPLMGAELNQAKHGGLTKFETAGDPIYNKTTPIYINGVKYYWKATEDKPGWGTGDTVILVNPQNGKELKMDKDRYETLSKKEWLPIYDNVYGKGLPNRIRGVEYLNYGTRPEDAVPQPVGPGTKRMFSNVEKREYEQGQQFSLDGKSYYEIVDPYAYTQGWSESVGSTSAGVAVNVTHEKAGPAVVVRPLNITYDQQGNVVYQRNDKAPLTYLTDEDILAARKGNKFVDVGGKPVFVGSGAVGSSANVQGGLEGNMNAQPQYTRTGRTFEKGGLIPVFQAGGSGDDKIYEAKNSAGKTVYEYKGTYYNTLEEAKAARTKASAPAGNPNSTPNNNSNTKPTLPKELESVKQYVTWDNNRKQWRVQLPDGTSPEVRDQVASVLTSYGFKDVVQSGAARVSGSAKDYNYFYAGLKPQDFESKFVRKFIGAEEAGKLDELATRKKYFELLGITGVTDDQLKDPKALYNNKEFMEKTYYPAFQKVLPTDKFREVMKNDTKWGLEHYDAIPDFSTPGKIPTPEIVYWCVPSSVEGENGQSGQGKKEEAPAGAVFYNTVAERDAACTGVKKTKTTVQKDVPKNWWLQDIGKFAVGLTDKVTEFDPVLYQVPIVEEDYVLLDPARQIAARQEQFNKGVDLVENTSDGQVARANVMGYSGQSAEDIANVISQYEQGNVGIVNNTNARNAQALRQGMLENTKLRGAYNDALAIKGQAAENERRQIKYRNLANRMEGVTNAQKTNEWLPLLTPSYRVNALDGSINFAQGYDPRDMYTGAIVGTNPGLYDPSQIASSVATAYDEGYRANISKGEEAAKQAGAAAARAVQMRLNNQNLGIGTNGAVMSPGMNQQQMLWNALNGMQE